MEGAMRARERGHTCLDAILGCATCGTGVNESSKMRAVRTHEALQLQLLSLRWPLLPRLLRR